MTRFNYHVSQEQFSPTELLSLAQQAEAVGFDGAFSSDHLQPWSPQQGHSAFTWSWLGAALQATRRLQFGTITVPGGWRYQPVVLAQAIATLCEMYPGRMPWLAFGSGEAVNECVTGQPWPAKEERNRRLQDGVQSIRRLLDGERVTVQGPPSVQEGRLWCGGGERPCLVGAATGEATARWLGGWAEGLLTTAPELSSLRRIIQAFRDGGGEGKPVHLKVNVCWAPTDAEAVRLAYDQWRFNGAGSTANAVWCQPEQFDEGTRHMKLDDIRDQVFVSHDLDAHVEHLRACAALGAESIDIHQVGSNQPAFLQVFGEAVLPALRQACV